MINLGDTYVFINSEDPDDSMNGQTVKVVRVDDRPRTVKAIGDILYRVESPDGNRFRFVFEEDLHATID